METENSKLTNELNNFNWGAFLLTWIWGLGNSTYIALVWFVFLFLPNNFLVWLIRLSFCIYLGVKGNKLAWKNKNWNSIEHFRKIQRTWATWGLILVVIIPLLLISLIYTYTISDKIKLEKIYNDYDNSVLLKDKKQLNNLTSFEWYMKYKYKDDKKGFEQWLRQNRCKGYLQYKMKQNTPIEKRYEYVKNVQEEFSHCMAIWQGEFNRDFDIEKFEQEYQEKKLKLEKEKLEKELEMLKLKELLDKPESESEFKYPKNIDKSVAFENKNEKYHIVSAYSAANNVDCDEKEGCYNKGIVKIYVTDKSAPVNLILTSCRTIFWDVIPSDGVKINKIYVWADYYQKDRVKAPEGILVYNIIDKRRLETGEIPSGRVKSELNKQILTFQEQPGNESPTDKFIVDGIIKNINFKDNVTLALNAKDVKTRKALFNEILKTYKNAYCDNHYIIPEANDLFEKFSLLSHTINYLEFEKNNYPDYITSNHYTVRCIFYGLDNENASKWKIGNSIVSYSILKSAGVELNKENLEKAKYCFDSDRETKTKNIAYCFSNKFKINHNNVEKILTSICDKEQSSCENYGIRAQKSFAEKFFNTNNL